MRRTIKPIIAVLMASTLTFAGLATQLIFGSAATAISPMIPTPAPAPMPEPGDYGNSFAFSSPGNGALVLLDTSGSMNDSDKTGMIKISGAKESLTQQAQLMPSQSKIGLMTYPSGPGTMGSGCDGAKIQLPVANESLAAMSGKLLSLPSPNGGTPTSDALVQAAEYLQANGLKAVTILLVSDGESNCGTPPCETVKDLRSKNIKVTINTVGFDISTEGSTELECIATAAGGRYVHAKDSDQLRQVLKDQLGNGLEVLLDAPKIAVPVLTRQFSVKATTTALPGHFVTNVKVRLEETNPGNGSVIRQSYQSIGNVAANMPITTTWSIAPPAKKDVTQSTYRLVASADGQTATSAEVTVRFSDTLPTGENLSPNLLGFKNILVLGDSYSSGEGAKSADFPYYASQGQSETCHRTHNQYANWIYNPDQLTILACSGAVSPNIDLYGQHDEKSQLAQLEQLMKNGYRPDLIFLTISGNDIGFVDIATQCAVAVFKQINPPDRKKYCPASPESGAVYDARIDLVNTVPTHVSDTLSRIAVKFQDRNLDTPPIAVLNYPEIFSVDPNKPTACNGFTSAQSVLLKYAFTDFNKIQKKLNLKIGEGVEVAAGKGLPVHVVRGSEYAIPASHNICSSDPWFVPLTYTRGITENPESMHPNAPGHMALAVAINTWANTLTSPPKASRTAVSVKNLTPRRFFQWGTKTVEFNEQTLVLAHEERIRLPYSEADIIVSGKTPR